MLRVRICISIQNISRKMIMKITLIEMLIINIACFDTNGALI